jgi:hypothetical protein
LQSKFDRSKIDSYAFHAVDKVGCDGVLPEAFRRRSQMARYTVVALAFDLKLVIAGQSKGRLLEDLRGYNAPTAGVERYWQAWPCARCARGRYSRLNHTGATRGRAGPTAAMNVSHDDSVAALRAVTSVEGMTADFYPFDMAFLHHQRGQGRQPRRLRRDLEAAGHDDGGRMGQFG